MQLKITTDIRYMDPIKKSFGNDTSTYFSEAVYILTSNYYEQQSSFFFNKCTYMKCAKYIMEYLFLEFGVLVCNDGYCIKDMNDTGVQNNIMDIKEEYMRDIVLIYYIVLYSDDINADKISVSTEGRLGKHFLSWAKKASLNKKVNIAVILNENKMLEYRKCKDLSVLLNIDKNSTDHIFEKYDKNKFDLTPCGEHIRYEYYMHFIVPEKMFTEFFTSIQIKREDSGEINIVREELTTDSRKGDKYHQIKNSIKTENIAESVTLIYDKEFLAERFVYSEKSRFLAAYRYNNGKLRRINKHQAFTMFHRLYKEMSEQTAYNKTKE